MSTRHTVTEVTTTELDEYALRQLAAETHDRDLMLDPENNGAAYTFHAGNNGGVAYIDPCFVAVAWGADPQWFACDLDAEDPGAIIEAALNGELVDA